MHSYNKFFSRRDKVQTEQAEEVTKESSGTVMNAIRYYEQI